MKNPGRLASDILSTVTVYFAILVVIVVLIIALSGLRIVKSGEVALVLRLGRLVGDTREEQIHEPGLLFAFPYIIDEVVTVPTGSVMRLDVTTHYTSTLMSGYSRNGYVITGDSNIVIISAAVQYVISDPVNYVLNVADAEAVINAAVSNAMIDCAASESVDSLLTTGKDQYASDVLKAASAKLDALGSGITLNTVELTTVSMPYEVRDIYDAVNSANVQASTLIEKAEQYRESLIPSAEAKAAQLISTAEGDYSTAVAAANNTLSEFRGVLEEYSAGGESVKVRLYNEKVTAILQKIKNIRIVTDSDTRIVLSGGE